MLKLLRKMQNGTIKFNSAPFGYDLKDGSIIINNAETEIIRKIFNMFLSGMGYLSICRELNESSVIRNEKGTKWVPSAIQYILTNEKYIGDSLWQKSYNTSFPFRKVRNSGELEKFYCSQTHEPIISKEDFEAVQKIIKERKCPNKDLIKKYPLSKNIYCGNCGSAFRRKVSNKKVYWVCRGHYYKLEQCSIKQISEQKFYNAFIVMYNKLKTNYSAIFPPMLSQLQELENAKFSNNKQYIEISKEIAQLKEQIHVLARLKTKGFLGESKCLKQTSELNSKIERLYAEQRKILKSDDEKMKLLIKSKRSLQS